MLLLNDYGFISRWKYPEYSKFQTEAFYNSLFCCFGWSYSPLLGNKRIRHPVRVGFVGESLSALETVVELDRRRMGREEGAQAVFPRRIPQSDELALAPLWREGARFSALIVSQANRCSREKQWPGWSQPEGKGSRCCRREALEIKVMQNRRTWDQKLRTAWNKEQGLCKAK